MRLALSGWSCERGTMLGNARGIAFHQSFYPRAMVDDCLTARKRSSNGAGRVKASGRNFPQGFQRLISKHRKLRFPRDCQRPPLEAANIEIGRSVGQSTGLSPVSKKGLEARITALERR